jgi:hypothetical protein
VAHFPKFYHHTKFQHPALNSATIISNAQVHTAVKLELDDRVKTEQDGEVFISIMLITSFMKIQLAPAILSVPEWGMRGYTPH